MPPPSPGPRCTGAPYGCASSLYQLLAIGTATPQHLAAVGSAPSPGIWFPNVFILMLWDLVSPLQPPGWLVSIGGSESTSRPCL